MTGYYMALALLPLMVLGFSRVPISRENWFWTIPVHLGISMCIGAAHTGLMYLSRELVYGLLGLGPYDYGHFGYRMLMEYHKQVLHYALVYAVLKGMALYRTNRERERAAAALELRNSELQRQLGQVQLQALRSQLNPHFLFNTLNMISSVMYEDCDRALRARGQPAPEPRASESKVANLLAQLAANQPRNPRILVRNGDRLFFVKANEIEWVEAEEKYVLLHTKSHRHMVRHSMSALEQQLEPAGFVRIHRSHPLNLEALQELVSLGGGDCIAVLKSGTHLSVGRNFKERLLAAMGQPGKAR